MNINRFGRVYTKAQITDVNTMLKDNFIANAHAKNISLAGREYPRVIGVKNGEVVIRESFTSQNGVKTIKYNKVNPYTHKITTVVRNVKI